MSTEITMYQGPPTLSIEQAIMVWLDEKHHRSESHKTQHAYRTTLHAFRDALQSAGLDLGWAGDIGKRSERHSRCEGARLLEVVRAAGISWQLVRTWPDADRSVESMLKRRHSGVRLCPICQHKAGRRKPMGEGRPVDFYREKAPAPNLDCAWCLAERGIAPGNGSHGICPRHAEEQYAGYKAARTLAGNTKSGIELSAPSLSTT